MKLKFNKKAIISFLPFVALAMLFWISSIMTKDATYSKDIFVKIQTDKDHIILDTELYKTNVTLSGTGLKFISISSFDKNNPLLVNIQPKDNLLTVEKIINSLHKEVDSKDIKIEKVVFPDTRIKIEKKISKNIGIRFNGLISFEKMYGYKSNPFFKPDQVTVSGPESVVKEIEYWRNEYKEFKNLKSSIKEQIRLEKPHNNKITITPETVELNIPVEEYTEKKLDIPVKINGIGDKNIDIVPRNIKISILTGVSKYDHVNVNDFVASVYINPDSLVEGSFPVSIIKKPSNVTIQYIQPDYVEVFTKSQ
ncbi:MAG TPA: hypothetical protein ENK66_02015 [Arcobacter sp.]|nr:hypothetical protein [Arcobacter sp.]